MTTPAINGALLSGPARDAVLAYLQANLNTIIATPDQQSLADGITLDQFKSEAFYISDSFDPLYMPACFVLIGRFKFDYTDDPNWVKGYHELKIVILTEEMGADRLQRKVEGYERAIFATLDQKSVSDPENRLQLKLVSDNVDFSDTFEKRMTDSRKKFRKSVIYEFKAYHFENRTTTL